MWIIGLGLATAVLTVRTIEQVELWYARKPRKW